MKPPITLKRTATDFEKLYVAADALNIFFAKKSGGPFEIMNRLMEELGEVATEVNVLEDNGIKREKAQPSKEKLASEIKDVMQVLFQMIRHYGVEQEVSTAIDHTVDIAVSKGLVEIVD